MIAPDRHIVLVGMTGVGKSTVGAQLARRVHRPLIDTDSEIERRTGRKVRHIFAEDGEAAFRAMESEVLAEAVAQPLPAVIAAAAGVVLAEANRTVLCSSSAQVIWLSASEAMILRRVRRGGHRPLLDDDPVATIQRMFEERTPLYRQVADVIVSVEQRSVADVVEAILR